jgi:L-fuconate dehydratase
MSHFTSFRTFDIRFPTSRDLDGSDAMNPEPDYSAAYLVLGTDAEDGLEGHSFVFTTGRGNDVQTVAIAALESWVRGREVEAVLEDLGGIGRELTSDPQLRWLGPEKGIIHMATGAVLNALWDLKAKRAGKPLWKLLADLSPQQVVDIVDLSYLSDVLTASEALDLLQAQVEGKREREQALLTDGYPAYTTGPGWLGYDDAKLQRLARQAVADGFRTIKLKVGGDLADDIRRLALARECVGTEVNIAIDANQRWDVAEAIAWVDKLAPFHPLWIEEPTNPDDILGHAAIRAAVSPVLVAAGEHVQNRVTFKQLLQAGAIDVVQIDATRVGGVNENIAILLLAAKFGVPVCPHAGGVGLCELVRHLAMFDFIAVSGSLTGRMIEYVDQLHEHFLDPVRLRDGRYLAPDLPGFSAQMLPTSLAAYEYPHGRVWASA